MPGRDHAEQPETAAPPARPESVAALASAQMLALQRTAGNRAVTRALTARREVARVPSAPAATVAAPAAGAPSSATRDVAAAEAPASAQSASSRTGGSDQEWFDDVVRNHLGATPPAGVDPYDWLLTTFVTVNVFGVTFGPLIPRFATKLQRASARAAQMIRDRLTAAGQTVAGAPTRQPGNNRPGGGREPGRQGPGHA